jgi:hypothetical protein
MDGLQLANYALMLRENLIRAEQKRRSGPTADSIKESPGQERDPNRSELSMVDPEVEAAIRPELIRQVQEMNLRYLSKRGALVVTQDEINRTIGPLMDADGKIAGRTREEFKSEFENQILAAADNRLRFHIEGNRVSAVYSAPERVGENVDASAVSQVLERFLSSKGVHTYMDLGAVSDPRAHLENLSSSPMNLATIRAAALNDDSEASRAALLEMGLCPHHIPQ